MAIYGARLVKAAVDSEVLTKLMKASTTITAGDFVHAEYDTVGLHGEVDVAGAGESILGVALETKTSTASGGETIQVVCGPNNVYEVDNDEDTSKFGATASGDYGAGEVFDLIGATGVQQIDTSTGATPADSSAQLLCVESEPNASDTSLGWFKIYERQY